MTITASQARAGLYRLIDQAAESHKPVVISGKRANAVLVSEEDWSAIQETLYLMAIPGMRESIKEAMAEPLAKSKRSLKWWLGIWLIPSTLLKTLKNFRPQG